MPALVDSAIIAALGIVLALQNVGQTRFDTKLDLLVDPWGFLSRGFGAWDPSAGFGQLQNQAYGYLFPMGPFFGVLHSAGVPPWVQQWLWVWLLLTVAYLGVRLLAMRLGLPWWAAAMGALAYALAPRVVSVLGPLSAEVLPAALLPWMLIPLARAGPSIKRAAFLSALPILLMGAANATLTLSVLVVPLVWILVRTQIRWRLLAWWTGFAIAFCAWWMAPLVVQGRFATPFLSFIESARDTTSGLTVAESLRGDVQWVAGIIDQGAPWWPAGFEYSSNSTVILGTFLLAGIGLAGLATRQMSERLANGVLVGLGLLVMSLGTLAAPLHEGWWALLDGVLAPFRNVHKFDPVLRLPLSLGVAAACVASAKMLDGRLAKVEKRTTGRLGVLAGIGVVIAAVALPLVTPGIAAGRTWEEMPSWWVDAAEWLHDEDPLARAIVVPGSGFGQYEWGRTIDEPLQALAQSPWVIDNGLPLGSVGSARLLDSVSSALRQGRPAPGLADTFARSGVRFVVVRNDVAIGPSRVPPRSVVAATLQGSPGFTLRASFGEVADWGNPMTVPDFGRDGPRPALEIYEIDRPAPTVAVAPLGDVAVMTGGPEALLPAAAEGLIAPTSPVVFVDDGPPEGAGGLQILTDLLQRRDRALARGSDAFSAVQAMDEPSRLSRSAKDLIPFDDPTFTVATYRGVAAIESTSSRAFADTLGPLQPERLPFAAMDGDDETWWQSGGMRGPVGESLEVAFLAPADLSGSTILVADNPLVGSRVTSVEVEAGGERWIEPVGAGGVVGPIVRSGVERVSALRVTAAQAVGRAGDFAIREIRVRGVSASRPLLTAFAPPTDGRQEALLLTSSQPARSACMMTDGTFRCDPYGTRADGDGGSLDRLVSVDDSLVGRIRLAGSLRSVPAAAALFDPLGSGIKARASSWLGSDVRVRPGAAVDGRLSTAWVADLGDPSPAIWLTWDSERPISRVRLVPLEEGQPFAMPLSVRVSAGGQSIETDVGPGGVVTFPVVNARSLRIEVIRASPLSSVDSVTGFLSAMPVGIAEVEIAGVEDLVYSPDLMAVSGSVCGFGPRLSIAGSEWETRVVTTLGDVLQGEPVRVLPCGIREVHLDSGTHRITVTGSELVDPLRLSIGPRPESSGAEAAGRDIEVAEWGSSNRSLKIGPGPASLLRVAESANTGWMAELNGVRLASTRVDGWQQAWLVPSGVGGQVTLTYAPSGLHRTGILLGVLLAVIAIAIGLVRRPTGGAMGTTSLSGVPWPATAVVLPILGLLLMGPAGAIVGLLSAAVRRSSTAPIVCVSSLALAGGLSLGGGLDQAVVLLALLGALTAVGVALTRCRVE